MPFLNSNEDPVMSELANLLQDAAAEISGPYLLRLGGVARARLDYSCGKSYALRGSGCERSTSALVAQLLPWPTVLDGSCMVTCKN